MTGLPETVGPADLARLLGVTTRRLQQLAEEGLLERPKRGRYLLVPAVQSYLQRRATREAEKPQSQRSAADAVRLKREILKLAIAERELIRLADAMGALEVLVGEFRAAAQALPARLTQDKEERRRIESEVDGFLDSLADRFRERSIALETGVEPLEDDTEDDAGGVGEA